MESSQRTRVTTARAIWRAIPARLRSSSATSVAGSCGGGLDFVATRAMRLTIRVPMQLGRQVEEETFELLSMKPSIRRQASSQ